MSSNLKHYLYTASVSSLMLATLASPALAGGPAEDVQLSAPKVAQASPSEVILDRIMVVGNAENIVDIAGSAQYIEQETLERQAYTDVNRVLRQVPGVNLNEEDGYGLRPNIGMRGSRSERSANITLMEDGVLMAPAPYASPSAYFFPNMSKVTGVEVRKGSSSIEYGPRTTSGVLNLITPSIPSEAQGNAIIGFGDDGQRRLGATFGNSADNIGLVVSYHRNQSEGFKDLDGGGDTGYRIQDVMGKFRIHSDITRDIYQELELKVGATNERSNETYLGLTDADFQANPYRRYAGSRNDVMRSSHDQVQLRHYIEPAEGLDVTTTAYRNRFHRNWYKLQDVTVNGSRQSLSRVLSRPGDFADHLAVLRGDVDSADDALKLRANNRTYDSRGIESIVGYQFETGEIKNQLQAGVRYHYDEEDRFQHEDRYRITGGQLVLTTAGAPGSHSNRISSANAIAGYVQNEMQYGAFSFTPGIRYERIRLKRENFSTSDPSRTGAGKTEFKRTVDAFIPGVGTGYQVNDNLSVFGGVHKGFTPPSAPGNATQAANIDIEESVNYEAGVRYSKGALYAELVGYFNDYSNLLGTDTLSSGNGEGTGDQFNGGEVDVHGIELSVQYDVAALLEKSRYRFPVGLTYTLTQAEFQNSFESNFDEWGTVNVGDELPYIPEHQLYFHAGVVDDKWNVIASAKYTDEMRTTAGSGSIASGEGTDSHFVVDLSSEYEIHKGIRTFLNVENLLDEEYVAARRPAGARPGKPRTFLAGLKVRF